MVAKVMHRHRRLALKMLAAAFAAALVFGLFRMTLRHVVARQLQATAQLIPGCSGIRYDALTIPYFALQCQLHGAALLFAGSDEEIPMDTVHIRRFRPGRELPRTLDAAVFGVRLRSAQPLMAPLSPYLQALDYTSLRGDVEVRWRREGDVQEAWRMDLALRVRGAGELTSSIRLAKVNMQGVALALEDPVNWLMVLPAAELVAAVCSYRDEGLYARALIAAAKEEGRPPADIRESVAGNLERRARMAEDPRLQAFWQTLAAFNRDPGSIAFNTALSEPLPLGRLLWMRTPGDIVRGFALESRVAGQTVSLQFQSTPAGRR